jgi:hypothetical protein
MINLRVPALVFKQFLSLAYIYLHVSKLSAKLDPSHIHLVGMVEFVADITSIHGAL